MTKYIVFLFVVAVSCKSKKPKGCYFQDKTIEGKTININGCFNNSLENGYWIHSDSIGNTIKEGTYEMGILVGTWTYNLPDSNNVTIEWQKYRNDKLKIETNLPSFLNKLEEGDFYVKMTESGKSNGIRVAIAILDSSSLPFALDRHFLQSEKEIKDRGWDFTRSTTTLDSDKGVRYMNFYEIVTSDEKRIALNSYGSILPGKVLEFTVNYRESDDVRGRLLYTALASNIFVSGSRYIIPYRTIVQ